MPYLRRQSSDSMYIPSYAPEKDVELKGDGSVVKSSAVFDWIETSLSSTHSILHLPPTASSSSQISSSAYQFDSNVTTDGCARRVYNSLDRPMKILQPVSSSHDYPPF